MSRRDKSAPLLCELHAHTTWSDGWCALEDIVDLYGSAGFDVLAVTDHALPEYDTRCPSIDENCFEDYLDAIDREAERALEEYGLLLVPGLELTWNDPDPDRAAHALLLGLREYVSPDDGLEAALGRGRSLGAATVAAHPHDTDRRGTRRFWVDRESLAPLVDRWELFNRGDLYGWVASEGRPGIGTGDFHRPEHLASWKTLLPCAKDERAVVGYLASPRPAFLVPVGAPEPVSLAA